MRRGGAAARPINSEAADRRTPLLHGLNDGEEGRGRK